MSGSAPPGGRDHIPALDGLRGVAVAGVVLFHLGYLRGGFLGVDMFFVLSGYLITTILVREWLGRGSVSLSAFWARRARRLLPALFMVVAVVGLYAAIGASAIDRGRIRADGLASLLYVSNWHEIAAGTDYFDLVRSASPLQHMWSLAIEEQFYLVWPLVALGLLGRRRHGQRTRPGLDRLLAGSVVLGVASVVLMVRTYHPGSGVQRGYYGTDTRAAAILMGAALAVVLQRWGPRLVGARARALDFAAIIAAGFLAVAWELAEGTSSWLYEGGLAASGLAVCVVIAALVTPSQGLLAALLRWSPLRALGRISYGVYLWHWPVIVVLDTERLHMHGLGLNLCRVAVTLGLALTSSALVELPVRRGALPGRLGLTVAGASAVACALILVAATTATTTPFDAEIASARAHPDQLQIATDPVPVTVPTTAAGGKAPPVRGPIRTLVVGDSGAYYLGSGLARMAPRFGRAVVNRGTVGCGVARGDGRFRLPDGRIIKDPTGCDQYLARWRDYLAFFQPQRVLLVLADVGGGDRFVNGRWMGDCDPDFRAYFAAEVRVAVALLASTGAKVAATTTPDVAVEPTAGLVRTTDCRNAALVAGLKGGAGVVDLRHWACPTPSTCVRTLEGVDLRPDRVHFIGPGADLAARWIFRRIKG